MPREARVDVKEISGLSRTSSTVFSSITLASLNLSRFMPAAASPLAVL